MTKNKTIDKIKDFNSVENIARRLQQDKEAEKVRQELLKKAEKLNSEKNNTNICNTSGFKVPEYRILIYPDQVSEVTKGGIIIPDKVLEDLQNAKTLATIVDIGEKAFDQGTDREWKNKPKIGDKILIPFSEGYKLFKEETKDGKEYRVILDRSIIVIQTNEEICQ